MSKRNRSVKSEDSQDAHLDSSPHSHPVPASSSQLLAPSNTVAASRKSNHALKLRRPVPVVAGAEDEDEAMDLQEVKSMHRDALDREAQLFSENQTLSTMVDELRASLSQKNVLVDDMRMKIDEIERQRAEESNSKQQHVNTLWLDRVFLRVMDRGARSAKYAFYPNLAVGMQAESLGLTHVLNLDASITSPVEGYRPSTIHHLAVKSSLRLADIFENGLRTGDYLEEKPQDRALFTVYIFAHRSLPSIVQEYQQKQYLIVGARCMVDRYNSKLAVHLEERVFSPRCLTRHSNVREYDVLQVAEDGGTPRPYPLKIQQAVEQARFHGVIKDVWVHKGVDQRHRYRGDPNPRVKVDLDLDRMIEIGPHGETRELGFWFS